MGNCNSNVAVVPPPKPIDVKKEDSQQPNKVQNVAALDNHATTTLLHGILPIALPIVRKAVSQQLVRDKMLLRNEHLLEEIDLDDKGESSLPVGPIDVQLDQIRVVDLETLVKDMKAMPEFAWPMQKRMMVLHKSHQENRQKHNQKLALSASSPVSASSAAQQLSPPPPSPPPYPTEMLILDIEGVKLNLELGPSIELVVPVNGPMGMKVDLEIGSGGSISKASVNVDIPRIRIWYMHETRQAYLAIMARPHILPRIHVNCDRGRGDFFEIEFNGGGGLDDTIETVLCGFGPSSLTLAEDDTHGTDKKNSKKSKEGRNWVADAIGRRISEALGAFAGVGENRPLEVDLKESIDASIDAALGKPRPVETIQAEIDVLQKELESVQKKDSATVASEEKKEEDADRAIDDPENVNDVAPSLFFCGIGM